MYSAQTYTGDGVTTDFAIPFPYLEQIHVEVSVNSVTTTFTFANAGTARLSPAPAVGAAVVVRRNSNRAARLVDFTDSSSLTESVLDLDSNQLMYLVQEAFDQASTQSYFSTDAEGSRVVNVADPIANTDGATKGWVQTYVASITADGNNLLPLDNEWTGLNTFSKKVNVMGATFDGVGVPISDTLNLDKALFVKNLTSNASFIGYGFTAWVERTTGFAALVGGQFNSALRGTLNGSNWGIAAEAWKDKTAQGPAIGGEVSVINLNDSAADPYNLRVGFDIVFKNREDASTQGGNAQNTFGETGNGTGGNYYNANTWALQFSAQTRSDANATYVGWSRGLLFRDGWCDTAKVIAYDNTRDYHPGDYALSGGHVYECAEFTNGNAPVVGGTAFWHDLGAGTEVKAIGIDFSGLGASTASRMLAAIKLRGQMPIVWDTEQHIATLFDPSTSRWMLTNDGGEKFGVNVATGDLYVNGAVITQGVPSSFSVNRNFAPQVIPSNTWTTIAFGTKEYDNRVEFSTATSRFTAQATGDYLITAQVQSENGTAAGYRLYSAIAVNGTTVRAGWGAYATDLAAYNSPICTKVRLNAGDFVTLLAYFSGPSTCSITGEPTATFLQGTKL